MTKEKILKKYEDDKEHHFHEVDREWILQAMQEYADQQLRLGVVVRKSEQLKEGHKNSFKYWLEENNYKKVYDKYVKWGFEYSESELIAKYNEEVMNL